jgi:hypothetical protein
MLKIIEDTMKNKKVGEVGSNAIWDGPLDTTGFPMGKGSSSGKDGMKIKQDNAVYTAGPITSKTYAKGNGRG